MKSFIPFLSIFLLLASCQKTKELKDYREQLVGEWELVKSFGMDTTLEYATGSRPMITFKQNGIFERKEQGGMVTTFAYYVDRKKDCHKNPLHIALFSKPLHSQENYMHQFMKIDQDSLFLSTSNCYMDGGVQKFIKIR